MRSAESLAARVALARRVLDVLAQRVAVEEAVGVLRGWQGCDSAAAREQLSSRRDGGRDEQAARVVALANSRAETGTDPDWD